MDFESFGLDARLMRAVKEAGYSEPTPIQAEAIPMLLKGRDAIGTAQTGTGKTAAFVLPMLQHLLANERNTRKSRVLIVTPTRELAEQINDTVRALAKYTRIRSCTVYGGVGMGPQVNALRAGVEIIVACPGRMLDHLEQKTGDLSNIEILVLDEADRMFDMGFLPSVRKLIDCTPRTRQTLLFSATFPPEVEKLSQHVLREPKRIAVGMTAPAKTVAHALYPVASHLKTKLLIDLLKKTDAFSMLVFTRTKHRASKIAKQIQNEGFKTAALHGDKSQNQRQQALDGFRSGKVQIMVATDIAARGLDVETVSHVINFDIPDTADTYIHRIGRTGRAEREGDAFTIVTPEDHEEVRMIERALGKPIERRKLDGFDYSAAPPPREPQQMRQPMREAGGRPGARFERPVGERTQNGRPGFGRDSRPEARTSRSDSPGGPRNAARPGFDRGPGSAQGYSKEPSIFDHPIGVNDERRPYPRRTPQNPAGSQSRPQRRGGKR